MDAVEPHWAKGGRGTSCIYSKLAQHVCGMQKEILVSVRGLFLDLKEKEESKAVEKCL